MGCWERACILPILLGTDRFPCGCDIWSGYLAIERWENSFLWSWFASLKLPLGEAGSCLHRHYFLKKEPMISFKQPSAQFTGKVHYGNELCVWVHDCEMLKSEQITGNRPRTLWNVKTIIPLVWMVLFSGASLSCALQESRETVKFNNSVMEGKQLIE